ncbi:MAG TPA: hypothetical protein VNN22_10685 [Verrucomicrobiae bacterium]|nr:hypothetical protein [Verrucomicrobiae bacterium]
MKPCVANQQIESAFIVETMKLDFDSTAGCLLERGELVLVE